MGFAEELEFLTTIPEDEPAFNLPSSVDHDRSGGRTAWLELFLQAATVTAEFYLANSCTDGIPMWDTGAPNLWRLGDYLTQTSDPYNLWEPVDSSAAVIAAQGLIRLGEYLQARPEDTNGRRYRQAGLTIARTLFQAPYLCEDSEHQGLVLHSVYHRPNGWDYVAPGQKVPNGESSLWGDYHARELALLILRQALRKETLHILLTRSLLQSAFASFRHLTP